MEWQPGTEKAVSSSSKHCAAESFRVFVLLNQNSRIQASINPHMEMTTLQVVTFWCHPHGEQWSALPGPRIWPQELCSSARKESWVLKKIFRGKKRLIELRSTNSWRDINSWRDMLVLTFLIHQYQTPRTCPILNFSVGDLPSCQIQLLNTLTPGRVYKKQLQNTIYFASQDGQKGWEETAQIAAGEV